MNNELRTNNAFTLMEVMVAVGLLAMMIAFSSVVFTISIDSHRAASANAEIMQKMRAVTDQLNADFRGLRRDAPLLIWFRRGRPGSLEDPNRYDQIMFFADGDFQSTQTYADLGFGLVPAPTGQPVRGNVARIYYGQAVMQDTGLYIYPWDQTDRFGYPDDKVRLLARRTHILTADPDYFLFPDTANFINSFTIPYYGAYFNNDYFEHDSISLSQWKQISKDPAYTNVLILNCFDSSAPGRPFVMLDDPKTFHMLLSENVGSFSIQWAYIYDNGLLREWRWWPSDDPDGNLDPFDSDFGEMGLPAFGIYFNTATPTNPTLTLIWRNPTQAVTQDPAGDPAIPSGYFPKALKFTFTIYDSKGIIKAGKTFTHIVYLD